MDSVKHAPSSTCAHQNTDTKDELYASALREAEEFADEFLDDAFIEIERRLLSLRHRKKPALVQAVTKGQIISLKQLLPELETEATNNCLSNAELINHAESAGESEWMGELSTLDYNDLYDEMEREALATTEETVSRMLKSLNKGRHESSAEPHIPLDTDQPTAAEFGLQNLPVPDVEFAELENESSSDNAAQTKHESADLSEHQEHTLFTLADDFQEQKTRHGSDPLHSANDDFHDEDIAVVSRIEPQPAANALQLSSEIPHIDPQKIAQALVDMYMENERVLAEQREAQRAAQATQRRQLVLISAGAVCAVLIAATIVYLLLSANMRALSVPDVSTPTVGSVPPPRYQSVNEPVSGAVVGMAVDTAPGNASSAQGTAIATDQVDAASVGAEEFNYYDESLYEPDALADAENSYYPVAESEFGITFDQREADVSPHELAYSQWAGGDLSGAQAAYERILQANPDDTEALVGLGSMAQQQGNNDLAVQYLVRAVKNQPDHAYALAALASLSSTNNREQLESDLMKLARNNPTVSELPFILGNWYARDKRWADAQQAYFDAFNRDNGSADYAFNLAVSLDQLGKSASAKSFYQKAVALAPSSITHFDVDQARARVEALN